MPHAVLIEGTQQNRTGYPAQYFDALIFSANIGCQYVIISLSSRTYQTEIQSDQGTLSNRRGSSVTERDPQPVCRAGACATKLSRSGLDTREAGREAGRLFHRRRLA